MKKTLISTLLVGLMTIVTACTKDDTFETYSSSNNNSSNNSSSSASSNNASDAASGNLATFTVSIDKTTAEPTTGVATAYYPEDEDNMANNSFATQVAIDLSAPEAKTENGVTITVNGGHVTADHGETTGICYYVTGTTANGSLTILGEKKYEVVLNNVSITNPDSAALNLLSKKRAFVVLADGTTNTLTDGTTSQNDHKGTLYAKGKLLLNGSGKLEVYGNYNNAIHSADYIIFNTGNNVYAKSTANNGIKANDGVIINGGVLNVEVSAAAAKGINCESDITVNGGRTTVITTGNGAWDTEDLEAKGAAGIKSDMNLTVNGGELWLKSTGTGGKGINVDSEAYFNGGNTYIVTEGGQFKANNDTASPKGIKVDGDIDISGGSIWVRTTGYNGEGIESKSTLTVSGGEVACYTYDDALNSAGDMTISGGYVYAQARNNDGIDANGNCYIKGGFVFAVSAGGPEVAIDANTEGGKKLYIQGGTIVALGGLEQGSQLSQSCYQTSWSSNTWYALQYGNTTFAYKTPSSGATGMVVSASSTPTLLSGVTVSGGTTYFGGVGTIGGTVSGGSSVSLSSYSGGGMGGGMGGGPGWR
ncbi:MAG: carbohydrate-binding domain-containing protein [Prevotella sp.]|nr:carbohydrate-binding domain-containing protein [Prevotella sp.]